MGRKKIPKSERKQQVWLQVKSKYLKEAKAKASELQKQFELRDYEGIRDTIQDNKES
jgi:hypothetical protein